MFCVTLSLSSDNFYRSLQFSSLSLSLAQVRSGNGCRPYFLTFPQTAPPTFPPLSLKAGLSHEICQNTSHSDTQRHQRVKRDTCLSNRNLAVRQSTGIEKKPSVCGLWMSTVMTCCTPDTSSIPAISLAAIGFRLSACLWSPL